MATMNDAVRQMYLTQTGREADPAGLEYFVNRFGSDIDPDELAIFRQMAADEVAGQEARNAAKTNSGYGISAETQKLLDQMNAAVAKMQATEATAQAGRDASAAFANRSNVLTPEIALALSYRASTTGVPASELDYYGGRAAVSAAAKAAGFTATDEFIQNYEAANNLPSTIAAPTAAAAAGNGATNAGMSIINAYQQVLGRTPNAQEIAYWTTQFGPDVDATELSAFNTAAGPELTARTGTAATTGTGATTGTTAATGARTGAVTLPTAAELRTMSQGSVLLTDADKAAADKAANAANVKTTPVRDPRADEAAWTAAGKAKNDADQIRQAYLSVLGRVPDAAGYKYFSDRFGTDVDAAELEIFRTMAAPELAARTTAGTTATTGTTAGTGTGMSITQAYQQVLGRTPNASEIAYWTNQFGASVDPTELSNFSVAAQPELSRTTTTNDAVRQMYLSVLGREPDASGLRYFSDRFGADVDASELDIFKGMSTQEIAANAARTAGTATGATGMSITQAYQQVLGRTPNASEIAYWTSQFGSSVDPTELSTFSVAAQPERAATPTTNNAIRQMYLSVLGREPDASGLKYFSDRFGTDVDATELGIFKGMSTQEIAANAAKTAGTGTTTAGGLTMPTTPRQVTGTQLAPAQVTNTAITGTPFRNVYTPATMQQNAPTLAQINAASQSANPYQSLMALTPQRTLSPGYAAQAGQTAANTNLGGFNPAVYNPPAAATTGGGLLTTVEQPGSANTSTGTGMAGINNQAAVSAALSNIGATGVGQTLATSVGNQLGSLTEADILGGNWTAVDPTAVAQAADAAGGFSSYGPDRNPDGISEAQAAFNGRPGGGGVPQGDPNPSDPFGGSAGAESGNYGGNYGGSGSGYMAMGGLVTPQQVKGRNPPGPDDGYTGLDIGEYVIRKKAVKKYGANIFEQINAGKIPAQRLKSLLE